VPALAEDVAVRGEHDGADPGVVADGRPPGREFEGPAHRADLGVTGGQAVRLRGRVGWGVAHGARLPAVPDVDPGGQGRPDAGVPSARRRAFHAGAGEPSRFGTRASPLPV
jgi:hypothetical protein